jgi:predicted Zn-dependent protease
MSLGQTVAIRDQLSFSRDAEREADRVGIQILTESGFDPAGMASMFERLSQAGRLYDNNAPAYLRTHPLSTERIADIQGRLQSGAYQSRGQQGNLRPLIAANSTGYDWIRAKLIASADLKVDGLRAARQRLELQLKDPKKSGPATLGSLHFGVSWAALLQRDFVAVAHHLRLAREQAEIGGFVQEVAPFLAHLQIQWAIAANESQSIDTLSQQFFKEFGAHRAIVRALIEARLLAKQPLETTARFARIATQQWPHDPQVWALLARTELASGRRAAQHAAVAEQYVLSGAYAAAIEQLSLARTAGDADFVAMSKIDARLTTIRAILRREQLERQQSNR